MFVAGDQYLECDAVFGGRDSLIVDFVLVKENSRLLAQT